MDFVKKHYEKILLGFVLLGLVGALVFLPVMINRDHEEQEQMKEGILQGRPMPLAGLDLARETNVLGRLESPYVLDFSTTNKLFNPVPWQRKADGSLIKGSQAGPSAAAVTKISPLYLILTLDSIETNEFGARYVVSVERQAAALPAQRGKRQHYASVGEKSIDAFTITAVEGSPENPSQLKLILQLKDTGERAVLSKDKPFQRVDGYAADLKYDLEKPPRTWQAQRVGADLKFAGDDYIIVAIDQGAVVLSARSNQKKTTLNYSPQSSE